MSARQNGFAVLVAIGCLVLAIACADKAKELDALLIRERAIKLEIQDIQDRLDRLEAYAIPAARAEDKP